MDRVEHEKLIIQDILNLHRNQELNINPWYQRRSVWTRSQKSYLINTIFEQKPIPSIYIRHSLDLDTEKSIREVVDGQQRIRSILEFVEGEFTARHPSHRKRVSYSHLNKNEMQEFRMTSLSVGYLLGATDADVIEIFGRLNSIAKTLNAQEKRNARFSGEFKQFCLRQAASRVHLWRDLGIFSANDIARMTEVQFISDLAYNMINGLSDYSSKRLNNIYAENEEEFRSENAIAKRMDKVFSIIVALDPSTIKDTIFNRHPLFFSLCIVLDSLKKKISSSTLSRCLHNIDESFNADIPLSDRTKRDAEFHNACTASTQRIRSRRIRNGYIRKALKIKV